MSLLSIRSWKALFVEHRIRIVPRLDAEGRPFSGPGADVLGDEARSLLAALAPVVDWFAARDPGAAVRSVSFDFELGRALCTLRYQASPLEVASKPHALRVDESVAPELFDLARAANVNVAAAAEVVLARRTVQPTLV